MVALKQALVPLFQHCQKAKQERRGGIETPFSRRSQRIWARKQERRGGIETPLWIKSESSK